MSFFKREPQEIVADDTISMTRVKGGNIHAPGHQPAVLDCPKCLAHPGQSCGGLRSGYYHGPRLTAYNRQVLRERKADRKTQETERQAEVDRLVANAEFHDTVKDALANAQARIDAQRPETIKEWARKCAYGEWDMITDTITNEIVAQYGWTDDHVRYLQRQEHIAVVLGDPAGGGAPGVITSAEKDDFVVHVKAWLDVRRVEVAS